MGARRVAGRGGTRVLREAPADEEKAWVRAGYIPIESRPSRKKRSQVPGGTKPQAVLRTHTDPFTTCGATRAPGRKFVEVEKERLVEENALSQV